MGTAIATRYVRRATASAPIRILSVSLAAAVLATAVDPYLGLRSPLAAQAANAALPVLGVLFVWALCGRAWLAVGFDVLVLQSLRYADRVKTRHLGSNLIYADFTVIPSLLTDPLLIPSFVATMTQVIGAAALFLVTAGVVWWFARRQQPESWQVRGACMGIAALGSTALWTTRAPDVIDQLKWEVFAQVTGATRVGITGNLLLGRMTARDARRPADQQAVEAFWNEPLVRSAERRITKQGNGRVPDIVLIQSESLFEPAELCGFADTPILKHLSRQKPMNGSLRVPVFGGRTLQTEFEVLTGAPVAFFPRSTFAYYDLLDHRVNALPHTLAEQGYETVVIHPNNRGFWHRYMAMPQMGFDVFRDIASFPDHRDYSIRGHVGDRALMREVLVELEAAESPTFIMAITMDNHGPWGAHPPTDESILDLPVRLTGFGRTQMADFLSRVIDADEAYGFLIQALGRRRRPTLVVLYGDHLPAIVPVYQQLCFKDGLPAPDHSPPYRVWANFPIPEPPNVLSAYLLPGWLLRSAGLALGGHSLANAIAGEVANDPSVPEAEKERVLSEYANVAAANVLKIAKPAHGAPTPQVSP